MRQQLCKCKREEEIELQTDSEREKGKNGGGGWGLCERVESSEREGKPEARQDERERQQNRVV